MRGITHRIGTWLIVGVSAAGACAGPRRELVFERTVPLGGARFTGPVTVDVVRRAAYGGRDLEYVVELEARCTPMLQLAYPDGEAAGLGQRDGTWQDLLSRRARVGASAADTSDASTTPGATAVPTTAVPAPESPTAAATAPASSTAVATATGSATAAAAVTVSTGRWQSVTTEAWPGQLQFRTERERRCKTTKRWSNRYLTGLDESGQITVWAATPQELEDARLAVRVYAVGEVAPPPRPAAAKPPRQARVAASASGSLAPRPARPRPPQPPPQIERPGIPRAEGATWRPGSWAWQPGSGRWVWIGGSWAPPPVQPPPATNDRGPEPAPGARWKSGEWTWEQTAGEWRWIPGEWLAPPPLVETPGAPPLPEQSWIDGRWIRTGATFTWRPGFWGTPRPRAETPPPPPAPGARWIAGVWLRVGASWRWSPGYYERTGRPPPPPRAETPPAPPRPDAVWLSGFWRWDAARNDFAWVPGYWELPPGTGYVWVWDEVDVTVTAPAGAIPTTPAAPRRRTGKWVLEVDLDVQLKARVQGGRR